MIRIKRIELAALREARGWRYWSDVAREMGAHPEALRRVLNMRDAAGVRVGTFAKLAKALSTPERQVELWDVIENVPDE